MSKRKIEELDYDSGSESPETAVDRLIAENTPINPNEVIHEFKVSNMGRVESRMGTRSFGSKCAEGYFHYASSVKKKMKMMKVHRLVALAFIGDPPTSEHYTVDHINNDRADNRVENLRWETLSNQAKFSHSRNPNRKTGGASRSKKVQCRRNADEPWGEIYASVREAARKNGASQGGISYAIKFGYRSVGMYWRFVTNVPEILDGEEWKTFTPSEHSFEKKTSLHHLIESRRNFQISNLGRVKSATGVISNGSEKGGYFVVGYGKSFYRVHDLVARLFIGPPPSSGHTVNHKDLNRSNNSATNLEWSTRSEQILHSHEKNLTRGSNRSKVSKEIIGRKVGDVEWTRYENASQAAKILNICCSQIGKCCRGGVKKPTGYEFQFAFDERAADLPGEVWKTIKIISS